MDKRTLSDCTIRYFGVVILFAFSIFLLAGCEPQYNHDQPDTAANRAGFQKHLGFPAPDAVSNLYYYADAFGADATYQLGFAAEPDVIKKIVDTHGLVAADAKKDVPIGSEFDWWDSEEVGMLPVYWKKKEDKEYYHYLWYSENTKQAYYLEFSL